MTRNESLTAVPYKHLVLVAPYFPPSNLAAVHRHRFLAKYLPRFGWDVQVITVLPDYYEEPPDPEIAQLLPHDLDVVRTRALPTKPVRIVGDISIRSLWWQYRALCHTIRHRRIDLVCLSIPPNFTAILGPLIWRKFKVPYIVDYQDPWVHPWHGSQVLLSKAWMSYQLSRLLEPYVLRHARLIMAVAPGYYSAVFDRYPWLADRPRLAVPIGADDADFEFLNRRPRPITLWDDDDRACHLVYAGGVLHAVGTVRLLVSSLRKFYDQRTSFTRDIHIHFIGTGTAKTDAGKTLISDLARSFEIDAFIHEHPERLPYLDVLNHLRHADAILVIGSTEPHYTPSKIFQVLQSGRPVFALLHEKSDAVALLRSIGSEPLITFDEHTDLAALLPDTTSALTGIASNKYPPVSQAASNTTSHFHAKSITQQIAEAFDRVIQTTKVKPKHSAVK